MDRALYGPGGFFVSGAGPAAHFRTSVHASAVFASAVLRLVERVDAALGHPDRLDVVDIGAGRGELLRALATLAARHRAAAGPAAGVSGEPTPSGRSGVIPPRAGVPETPPLAARLHLTAVERAPRPADLPREIDWRDESPTGITGLLLATEWLDNVPLDVAVDTDDGSRYLLVDPDTGEESVGGQVSSGDAGWLATWWPRTTTVPAASTGPGFRATPTATSGRAEIGRTRDEAWADAVRKIDRGLALAVDYGHTRDERPVDGTLTGYRAGRQVAPVPDGSCDVTAHVAVDSVAAAGATVAGRTYTLVSQREALRALGADGRRPPLTLASTDPAGYVRALAAASAVAELTDPADLGGHWWLLQAVGVDLD
jgi:SAM-dependent MidA family methyltransferase